MTTLISFSLLVSGIALSPKLRGTCTCVVGSNNYCAVAPVPFANDGNQMIIVLDIDKKPSEGTAKVICMKGEK